MKCYAAKASNLVPSICEQTDWKAGFYNFGKLAQEKPFRRFYNPGVILHEGAKWLVVRVSEEIDGSPYGRNRLLALKLNEENQPTNGFKVNFGEAYTDQHFEDPRIIRLDSGQLLLSCTTFYLEVIRMMDTTMQQWRGAHQCIVTLDDTFQPLTTFDPVYGYNGGSVMQNASDAKGIAFSEKNWVWFQHNGLLHTVYMTEPHEVLSWNDDFSAVKEKYETDGPPEGWFKYGHPRGGTPPVRLGDEYWSFFHSSTPWDEWNAVHPGHARRRYHMGAYAFEAKPPFKITRFSRKPILTGSQKDPWSDGLPLVVFPCGALFESSQTWYITMGINDCASAWISIPHEELLPLTPLINEPQATSTEDSVTTAEPETHGGDNPHTGTVEERHECCGVDGEDACPASSAGDAGDSEGHGATPAVAQRKRGRRIGRGRRKSVLATGGL